MKANPKEMLDTMLGHLDFAFEIKETSGPHGVTLQIYSPEKERIIGRRGETLDDLQLLLNRMIQAQDHNAPRVVIDCEHHREIEDTAFLGRIRQMAEIVRATGRSYQLEPMNSYERRIVHNAFKEDPDLETWSPRDDNRLKRITLRKKRTPGQS